MKTYTHKILQTREEIHKYPEAHTRFKSTYPHLKIPAPHLPPRYWFLQFIILQAKPDFLRVMADSRTEAGKTQDNLAHLVMPENKEVPQRQ